MVAPSPHIGSGDNRLGTAIAHASTYGLDNGLCGSYASKPDRTITSGLPTIHSERTGPMMPLPHVAH